MDLRAVLPGLRRGRTVPLSTVGLLALGVAGVMTLFAPLRTLVLAPLPFPEPEQLVVVGAPVLDLYSTSFPNREALNALFIGMAAYRTNGDALAHVSSNGPPPVRAVVTAVSPEFFATMGIPPWLGLDFRERPVDAHVAVVGYEFWKTRLHEAVDFNASTLTLNGNPFEILGVAPSGFSFPDGTEIWIPSKAASGQGQWTVIARLQPHVSIEAAATRLRTMASPGPGLSQTALPTLQRLRVYLVGERRTLLWILWLTSVLFLLLTSTGASNLLWAQGLHRRREMATRRALGATRSQLVRQMLAETLVLVVVGAAIGFWISTVGIRYLRQWIPTVVPADPGVASPAGVLLLVAVVLVSTLICGLAPALSASRADRASAHVGRAAMKAPVIRRKVHLPELLAGVQLALAMTLLVCTILLLRSLISIVRLPLGFNPENVVVLRVDLPPFTQLLDASQRFSRQVLADSRLGVADRGVVVVNDERAYARTVGPALTALKQRNEAWHATVMSHLLATPGVVAVGTISPPPFAKGGNQLAAIIQVDPRDGQLRGDYTGGLVRVVSPEAFRVLGIRVLTGRTFLPEENVPLRLMRVLTDPSDTGNDAAIVNDTLARRFWPNENPIGKEFHYLGRRTVVGIVSDIHESGSRLDVQPTVYVPTSFQDQTWNLVLKLRPGTPVSLVAETTTKELAALIPGLPMPAAQPLSDLIDEPLHNLRLGLVLLACFATVGTIVAALGVYAIASEVAANRAKEIGVRIALGATPNQIRRLAAWRSFRIVLLAIPVGTIGSWMLAQGLSHWLFQVSPLDPSSALAAGTILVFVAFVAGLPPAFRSSLMDPAEILRWDR